MKKETYQFFSNIPLLGTQFKRSVDFHNSMTIKTLMCSPALESYREDPRGFEAALADAFDVVMKPVNAYLEEHPDIQLTAKLVDDIHTGKLK